jgi:hypothetical protein
MVPFIAPEMWAITIILWDLMDDPEVASDPLDVVVHDRVP